MTDSKLLVFTKDAATENTLQELGFQVTIEHRTDTLIEQAHHHRPHAVLVDAMTEEGLAALRALREDTRTNYLPIVAIIPKESASMETILAAGADEFISPPLEKLEIQTRLRSVIQRGHVRNSSELLHINTQSMNGIVDILIHDFRNPLGITLSSLQLLLEILQDEPETYPPEVAVLMRHALFAAQRQAFLMEDMLDIFRLEMNEMPIVFEAVSLLPILEKGAGYIREAGKYNNITIELNLPTKLPRVLADSTLLERVVNAALDTSLKFCMPGKGIRVEVAGDKNGVSIFIIDPGRPVLPPYDQERFFQLEYQNEARLKSSRSSVAMGMPFCYVAMKRMNGDIRIHTDHPTGLTTLTLWLPPST
jgi:signal transduction histidine kinase